MFKYYILSTIVAWSFMLPVTASSNMGKRLEEAQTVFSDDISLLSSFVEDVLASNPKINSIQSDVDIAFAKKNSADQPLYNPELELDYENTDADTSSLGISQTIDWSDKRGARTKVASYEHNRAIAKYNISRNIFVANLLHGLSKYHSARDKDVLLKLRIELLEEFVDLATKRYQSGDLNQSELSLAKLAYAEARMQKTRTSSELIDAQQLLITMTGGSSKNWPGLPSVLPQVELKTTQLDELISQLPIFQEQIARVESAMANVKLRIREKNSDPTIGIRAGRDDTDDLIGFTLTIPLNVRNNFSSEVNIANAQLTQVEYESLIIARETKSKLLSSSNRYQLVRKTWQSWQETGPANMANQFSLIHKQWKASEISTTDYFMQLNQTLNTRLSAIELRNELWNTWVDWLESSAQVTKWLKLNNQIHI